MVIYNAGNHSHRQHFYGDSGDTKPECANIGDLFYEFDTGLTAIFDGTNWREYVQPTFYVEKDGD